MWHAVFGVKHQEAPSAIWRISELPNLKAWAHSVLIFFFLSFLSSLFSTGGMNYSNCRMAWTVSAQTLKTSCCCVCSVWGSEPFCNFRSRSPESFPFSSPLPLYFCIPCLPHLLLLWPLLISPSTVVAEQSCVTMLMMSPLCPRLLFFPKKKQKKTVCCLSWLAVFLCEVLTLFKKKHVKKGQDKTKALWWEGFAGYAFQGFGTIADRRSILRSLLSQFLVWSFFFYHTLCCYCCSG